MDRIDSVSVVPKVAGWIALAIGVANASGWLGGLDVFIAFLPGLPKMVPATALLVLLAAASLLLQTTRSGRHRFGAALGLATAAIAGAMVLAHLLHLPLGPFLATAVGQQNEVSLSSLPTAAMFLGLGAALGLTLSGRGIVPAQSAAMAVLLISLLNAASYFFRDTFLYQLMPGQGVAIPTTGATIALALGALFLRPGRGIMAAVTGVTAAGRIIRRVLVAAGAVPLLLGAAVAAGLQAGLYDAGTAVILLVWGTIVLLTAIIWRLSLQLHAVEAARRQAAAELHRTLQELHDADRRKDVFLATLAHELRNPLAPMKVVAELLGRDMHSDPGQLRRMSDVIGRQVDHMVHLVDDLMDVSRVRRGQIVLERSPVELNQVLNTAHEQARPLIERKGHACRIEVADAPVWVLGDRKRLVQVVVNLLNNAAKYTPPGGELGVSLRSVGQQAEIAVRDNGSGIAPELLPSVYELFTQAEVTPERGEGGLGLGLALVKRLTELQGGSVRAASAGAGQGSTFTVVLPLLDATTPDARAASMTAG
ncbi:MAG: HAMP domain-containing sensor histidine kinase [Pseudomonadota bacterium]